MASPYALDFSPITEELHRNRLLQLQADAAARAQAQLDMTQEKFGWERQDEAARNAAARELANDPNAWEKARKAALAGGNVKLASDLYGVQGTAGNLSQTEAYRDYVKNGGVMPAPPTGGAARVAGPTGAAPQAAPPAAGAAPMPAAGENPWAPGGAAHRAFSKSIAEILGTHVMGAQDPATAAKNYHDFLQHPELAPYLAAAGLKGGPDWHVEASNLFNEASQHAGGNNIASMDNAYGAHGTTARSGIPVAGRAPEGMPQVPQSASMSPQVGAVPPPPTQQPAVGQPANITPGDRQMIIRTAALEDSRDPAKVAETILNRAKFLGKSPSEVIIATAYNAVRNPRFNSLGPGNPEYDRAVAQIQPLLDGKVPMGNLTHFISPELQARQGNEMPGWAQTKPDYFNEGTNYYSRPQDFGQPAPRALTVPTQAPPQTPPIALGGPQAQQQPQQPELPAPMFSGMSFTPPQLAPGAPAPQAPQPQPQAQPPVPAAVNPSRPQPSNLTSDQQVALAMINQKKQDIRMMSVTPGMTAAAEQEQKSLDEQIKSGQIFVPQLGKMVPIAQHAENLAHVKATEETATGRAKYYETIHAGLSGSGHIAAQQKQNIYALKTILDDSAAFNGFGSLANLKQSTLNALATLGVAPEAAANRELFDLVVARVLNDQFAGMRSMASESGEKGARVFKSMLDVEERAIPHPNDSIAGLKLKVGMMDHAGDLMMRWGNLADQYYLDHGKLGPAFDMALRAEMAKARLPGLEGGRTAAGQQEAGAAPGAAGQTQTATAQPAAAKLTTEQQGEYPLGTEMKFNDIPYRRAVGPDGKAGWERIKAEAPANQPAAADLQRRAQMTPIERAAENRAAAEARRAAAPAQAAAAAQETQQQASQVQRGYDLDMQRLKPEDLARKYGNVLGQLTPEQQRHYQSVLNALVPMNPRR